MGTQIMDNFAESLSLITLTILTLFLIAVPNPVPTATAAGLTVMCLFVALIFFVRIGLSRYDSLLLQIARASTVSSKSAAELKAAEAARKEREIDRKIALMMKRDFGTSLHTTEAANTATA